MLQKIKGTLDKDQKPENWWTLIKDIPVHGNEIKPKRSSMVRVYFENIGGFRIQPRGPIHNNNDKIKYYNTMTTRLETDIICGVEARSNWSILPKNYQLSNLLQLREGARVITAHNEHEQFSIPQQGGTFLVTKE